MIGVGLGHAGGDGPHPGLGHQFDADAGLGVDVLEVVDQLRQVFDGVDVVVRRRRDQPHAGGRMPHLGDPFVHLVAGQLAALPRFGPLRHLDLDGVGVDQVLGGDAEPARGDLLHRRAHRVAVGQRDVAVRVFAALAGVGLAAEPVHGDGQVDVRLPGQRAEGHGAGGEAFDDFADRFDFGQRQRLGGGLELEQAAQVEQPVAAGVHRAGVLLIYSVIAGADRVLQ